MPYKVPFPSIHRRTVSSRLQRDSPLFSILEFGGRVCVYAPHSLDRHGLSGYWVPHIVLGSRDTKKKEAGSLPELFSTWELVA